MQAQAAPLQGATVVSDITIALSGCITLALVVALWFALRRIGELEEENETQREVIERKLGEEE